MTEHPRFQPAGVVQTFRDENGYTHLARATTTEEQRTEAVEHALRLMQASSASELRIVVEWTRGDPTILEVKAHVEHLARDQALYCEEETHEFSMNGADADLTTAQRSSRTIREVAALADAGML